VRDGRRGRCTVRHSNWPAASSRSATSRLFITAVIRASRRSPSPRGGRRNHRAAGRPESLACGRPRAPPSSSMPASSPAAASRSPSTARSYLIGRLYRDDARDEVGTDHRITTAPGPPTAPLLASWPSDPRAGDIARNAPAALTPSRGVRVQTWVRPKRAPTTSHSGSARRAVRWAHGRRPPLARQGKAGRLLLLRHPGLAQAGEISSLEQGADLRYSPVSRGLHASDARVAIVSAQPTGFGEFGGGAFGVTVEGVG
jgi:hypothetical protein